MLEVTANLWFVPLWSYSHTKIINTIRIVENYPNSGLCSYKLNTYYLHMLRIFMLQVTANL